MNRLVAAIVLFAALSCCATQATASVTFSDGDFNDADWNIYAITVPNGGTWNSTQATGGTPGFYRSDGISLNPPPAPGLRSTVGIVHLFNGATYDPSTEGAVASINYSEDAIWLSGDSAHSRRTGLAVRQSSEVYIMVGGVVEGTETTWHPVTATLLQNDFIRLDPTDGVNGVDETGIPNFTSSGGLMEFGYIQFNTSHIPAGLLVVGIDNWQVTINPVPEPSTLTLAALGLAAGLLAWRRRHAR